MKFKSTQHFFVIAVIATLFFSFSSQHPVGRSGAPGDGLCSDCHGGSGGGFDGDITLSGLPTDAVPGQVYSLTFDVDVTMGSPIRGGFQIVALKNSDDSQAGIWSNNDSNSSFRTSSGRTYFGHNPAQNYSGGNINWTADWEAPVIDDDVTFYMASVMANGNGSSNGDKVIVNTLTTTIEAIDPIVIDFSNIVGTTCFDGNNGQATANVSGGTGPYMYAWENGDVSMTSLDLMAGSNSLTVTDDVGAQLSTTVIIPEPSEIEIFPAVDDVSCFGDENGRADLNPSGGTGNLTCDWGPSIGMGCVQADLEVGNYFATISDENGCAAVVEIEIGEPDRLEVSLTVMNATASGNDGSVNARGVGGVRPYSFRWSNGVTESGNSSMIDGLSPGVYEVTVTDLNGCSVEAQETVGGLTCDLMVLPIIDEVACYGDSTGQISLNVSGVSTGVTFNWSNGATTSEILNVPAGLYDVTITQDSTCFEVLTGLNVTEPDSLQAMISLLVNPSCGSANNGRINLNIIGGTQGYDLQWSNGLVNDTIITGLDTLINLPDTLSQLTVGSYGYTITDANGCEIVDSIILNNSDVLAPFISLQDIEIILDESGFADAISFDMIDAGTFDNCEIDSVLFNTGSFDCSDIGINPFTVIVTDAKGNSSSDVVNITVLDETAPVIDCSASTMTLTTCGGVFYEIPIATDNCDVPLIELVEGLPSGSSFPVGVTSVVYSATDECGNSSTCSFDVTVNNNLEAIINVENASCANNDGNINVVVSGGTPPYIIEPSTLMGLAGGEYNIQITDADGCVYVELVTVEQEDNDLLATLTVFDATCFGNSDGSVTADIEGGSGMYNIDYGMNVNPDSLSRGDYEIIVTDSLTGCTYTQAFEIKSAELFEVTITNIEMDACTGEILDVAIQVTGGILPFQADTSTVGGRLTLTLVDSLGCKTSASVPQILILDTLVISDFEIIPSDNTDNGAINVTVEGGVVPYAYTWTNSSGDVFSTTPNVADLSPGDYLFQVTDSNGCMRTVVYTVDFVSSLAELDIDNIYLNVYPNPSSDIIKVEALNELPNGLRIYNSSGQVVRRINIKSDDSVIDISNFNAGIYYMRFSYEGKEIVKKLVKL